MEQVTKMFEVKQQFIIGFHARKNDITERMNKRLVNVLSKSVKIPVECDRRLP